MLIIVCKFVVLEPEVPIDLCGYLDTFSQNLRSLYPRYIIWIKVCQLINVGRFDFNIFMLTSRPLNCAQVL